VPLQRSCLHLGLQQLLPLQVCQALQHACFKPCQVHWVGCWLCYQSRGSNHGHRLVHHILREPARRGLQHHLLLLCHCCLCLLQDTRARWLLELLLQHLLLLLQQQQLQLPLPLPLLLLECKPRLSATNSSSSSSSSRGSSCWA
jgi:hypothetical protein